MRGLVLRAFPEGEISLGPIFLYLLATAMTRLRTPWLSLSFAFALLTPAASHGEEAPPPEPESTGEEAPPPESEDAASPVQEEPASDAAESTGPAGLPADLRPPVLRSSISPPVPDDLLPKGGPIVEVELLLEIDEEGTVLDWSVKTSSGYPELDEAVLSVAPLLDFYPALYQGKHVAKNIARAATKRPQSAFHPHPVPTGLPVGENWGYVEWHGVYVAGKFGALVRRWMELYGYCQLVPLKTALPVWRAHHLSEVDA